MPQTCFRLEVACALFTEKKNICMRRAQYGRCISIIVLWLLNLMHEIKVNCCFFSFQYELMYFRANSAVISSHTHTIGFKYVWYQTNRVSFFIKKKTVTMRVYGMRSTASASPQVLHCCSAPVRTFRNCMVCKTVISVYWLSWRFFNQSFIPCFRKHILGILHKQSLIDYVSSRKKYDSFFSSVFFYSCSSR